MSTTSNSGTLFCFELAPFLLSLITEQRQRFENTLCLGECFERDNLKNEQCTDLFGMWQNLAMRKFLSKIGLPVKIQDDSCHKVWLCCNFDKLKNNRYTKSSLQKEPVSCAKFCFPVWRGHTEVDLPIFSALLIDFLV